MRSFDRTLRNVLIGAVIAIILIVIQVITYLFKAYWIYKKERAYLRERVKNGYVFIGNILYDTDPFSKYDICEIIANEEGITITERGYEFTPETRYSIGKMKLTQKFDPHCLKLSYKQILSCTYESQKVFPRHACPVEYVASYNDNSEILTITIRNNLMESKNLIFILNADPLFVKLNHDDYGFDAFFKYVNDHIKAANEEQAEQELPV